MPGRLAFPLFLASSLCAASAVQADAPRPNIVLIVIDDFGWADLGCYGSTYHETPNLDALARRGMRFTDAYAACPVCSPSRAALLTGKHPARLQLTDWLPGRSDRPSQKLRRPPIRQELPLEEITLAEALKPAGYASASIGKWHLGGPPFWPEHQGFDLNVGGTATGSPPGGYFGFRTPNLRARDDSEYLTDRLTDEAIAFVERNRSRPFFLYLAHYAVHIPLQSRPEILERYRANPAAGSPQTNPIYAAMIESVDEGVGRLMRRLGDLGIDDRTIVIFTSDNGGLSVKEGPNTPATSNSPLRAGKGYLYEGGIRVPLIVAWPGATRPGSVCAAPVIGQDLAPTIREIAGVAPAAGAVDGESLAPILKSTGGLRRDALFWHYPHYSNQGGKPGGAIRQGSLKLIEWYEDGRAELYDLAEDPGERKDLAGDRPADVERLRGRLAGWRELVSAQMPTPNPQYLPSKSEHP
jgi:arylsulfatase A-like enzyme